MSNKDLYEDHSPISILSGSADLSLTAGEAYRNVPRSCYFASQCMGKGLEVAQLELISNNLETTLVYPRKNYQSLSKSANLCERERCCFSLISHKDDSAIRK